MQYYMIYNFQAPSPLEAQQVNSNFVIALCAPPGRVACIQQLYFSPLLSPYALPGLKAI